MVNFTLSGIRCPRGGKENPEPFSAEVLAYAKDTVIISFLYLLSLLFCFVSPFYILAYLPFPHRSCNEPLKSKLSPLTGEALLSVSFTLPREMILDWIW